METDPECSCGLIIDEPGDLNATPGHIATAVRILDINKAVAALDAQCKAETENQGDIT